MKSIFKIICLFLLYSSCTGNKDCRWKIKEDCRDSIKSYITSHKEYKSYLVVFKYAISDQAGIVTTGFLVGPLYEQSKREFSSLLPIEIDNAKVFIQSDLQLLMDGDEKTIDESDSDSFIYDYNKNESAAVNYVRHAVYMYYDDSRLMVNTRPDTLFLPKILEDEMILDGK